ncbi:MAG: response regulator [Ignavibacteriaceae bacterium]|jgi:sigma-B regulation protein RsbU (phosphoserine phosphatase)
MNKVLIVEDEKDTLFILNKLLTKNDYEVFTSTNGQEALDVLNKDIPDVIIADWTMPIMDGLELCNIVKKNEKFKLVYFIILTARASLKDRVTGLDVGADDFLVKPVQNQELLARIRSGIRIHNLQNELKNIEHDKAIVEMACTIGHKINNPLSSLVMTVKNIEDDLKDVGNQSFKEDFQVINQSIERIKVLANDLAHLKNPEIIDYSNDSKMIKLD